MPIPVVRPLLYATLLLTGTALAWPVHAAPVSATIVAEKADLLAAPRTISDTIFLATSHPAIAARAAQVTAGQAGVGVAQAANLPSLGLDAQGGVQRYDSGLGIRGTSPVGLARLSLSQSVYDAGARAADVSAADARLTGAEGDLAWQQRQQVFAAAQAHINLWLAQQLAVADQQSLDALAQIDTATRHRRAVGDATVTEVSEAASRVAAAKARLTAQQTALNAARQSYLAAVGTPVATVAAPTLPPIPGVLAFTAVSGTQGFTPATQQLLATAVLHHPLLAAAAARTVEAGAGVNHAEAQQYPTLDLAGNAQHDAFGGLERNESTNTGTATLNLHYQLYQGGGIKAGIHQASALKKAAEADRDSIALQVTAETNAATARWLGAGQELAQQAVALSESRAVLGSLDTEMRQGNRTLRDLLDARRDEIDVLSAWLAAAAQQAQTGYDLQRWLGDTTEPLTPGLLAAQPLRPDLSPQALSILPGITWAELAPRPVVAVASPTAPLPPLPLPLPVSESLTARATPTTLVTSSLVAGAASLPAATDPVSPTRPAGQAVAAITATAKDAPREPLPDLSAIIPAAGNETPLPTTADPVVPSLLKNLPAGAWLVYLPPATPAATQSKK